MHNYDFIEFCNIARNIVYSIWIQNYKRPRNYRLMHLSHNRSCSCRCMTTVHAQVHAHVYVNEHVFCKTFQIFYTCLCWHSWTCYYLTLLSSDPPPPLRPATTTRRKAGSVVDKNSLDTFFMGGGVSQINCKLIMAANTDPTEKLTK